MMPLHSNTNNKHHDQFVNDLIRKYVVSSFGAPKLVQYTCRFTYHKRTQRHLSKQNEVFYVRLSFLDVYADKTRPPSVTLQLSCDLSLTAASCTCDDWEFCPPWGFFLYVRTCHMWRSMSPNSWENGQGGPLKPHWKWRSEKEEVLLLWNNFNTMSPCLQCAAVTCL